MPTLLFENGPDRGSGVELRPGTTYTLGRDPRADIVVRDDLVSRQHCKIKEYKGAWYLRDSGSTNGVLVNNHQVKQVELHFGDKLQLGGAVLTFLEEDLESVRKETTLGGYRLRHRIGRGGMGTVFQALQVSLGREVALKVLSPHLTEDETFITQFLREARAAGQLNHPHIVQVYDVGEEDGTYYYSMEYIEGGSLEDRLREDGKVPVEESIELIRQAALALEFAESRQIVHRDIKPDNLMLTPDGRVKIADLGLALSLSESAAESGQPILGTPHFISPEQALRREVDIRSDIYSLGATWYRMLTGRTLFEGRSAEEIIKQAVRAQPTPIRELRPEVPERVATVVHKMLAKEPEERHQSPVELLEELAALQHRRGRTILLWSAVGVALAAIAVAVTLALREPEVVTITETDEDAARAVFDAMSEAEQAKAELAALRSYHTTTFDRATAASERAALEAWLKQNQHIPMPEVSVARERIAAIDQAQAREQARLAAIQQRREQVLGDARRAWDRARESADLGAMVRAQQALAAVEDEDPDNQRLFQEQAERWFRELPELVGARLAQDQARIQALDAAGDPEQALARCQEVAAWYAPPPELELPVELREPLQVARDWFQERQGTLTAAMEADRRETLETDLQAVVDACGRPLRDAVLGLDFQGARERLAAALEETHSEPYRALLQSQLEPLRVGQRYLDRFLTALEDGSLPREDVFFLEGDEQEPGLLEGREPGTFQLKIRYPRPRGSVTGTVDLRELVTPDHLHQLFFDHVEAAPEDRVALLRLFLLVEVCRYARQMDAVADAMGRYDPDQGWDAELKVALPELRDRAGYQLSSILRRVQESTPGHEDEFEALQRAVERELACHAALRKALGPFLDAPQGLSWAAAHQRLIQLLQEHRRTLLVRMVYRLLHAGSDYPLVAP